MKYLKPIIYTLLAGGVMAFSGCNFLDRKPLDQVGPDDFYTNPDQLASFVNNYYTIFASHGGWGAGNARLDDGTDNQAAPDGNKARFTKENWKVPTQGGIGFGNIRNVNWFINTVEQRKAEGKIAGDVKDIDHYIGEAYFIRAFLYFSKLKTYGDFPIETNPLPSVKDSLVESSKRMPRNEVARFILQDLDKAIAKMKPEMPANQHLSARVANLFKSRVALYEATFEKYHQGSGRVPGDANWPGKDKEWNKGKTFDINAEVDFFLTQAMEAAKACADAVPFTTQNSRKMNPDVGEYQGWNPFFEMFSDRDLSKYPEILLWRQYNLDRSVAHSVTNYLIKGSGTGWTRSLVESFLTKDGKPIDAPGNTLYQGDATLAKVKANRDERLRLFMFDEADPGSVEGKIVPVGTPNFFGPQEARDVTGYKPRKFLNYLPSENDRSGSVVAQAGCPIFRVAEAYLNYIEACYLKTNTIDATAAEYWKRLRDRAGITGDYTVTVAATDMSKVADVNRPSYDWGAFSAAKPVDATLYTIRRERRCEFAGEGYRWDDLVRWRAMDQVKNYQIEGMNFWDEMYKSDYFLEKDDKGNLVHEIKADGSSNSNVSAKELSKYFRPYQVIKDNNQLYEGYTFYQAHYLSPFSFEERKLTSPDKTVENSYLYQNPGWPVEAQGEAEY